MLPNKPMKLTAIDGPAALSAGCYADSSGSAIGELKTSERISRGAEVPYPCGRAHRLPVCCGSRVSSAGRHRRRRLGERHRTRVSDAPSPVRAFPRAAFGRTGRKPGIFPVRSTWPQPALLGLSQQRLQLPVAGLHPLVHAGGDRAVAGLHGDVLLCDAHRGDAALFGELVLLHEGTNGLT